MSSNPMLNRNVMESTIATDEPMSIQGAVNKTIILSLIVLAAGSFTWDLCAKGFADKSSMLMIAGAIAGFILCLVTCFMPRHAKITAPMYALCEGLFLGSISYLYGSMFDGIVFNAVAITFTAMFVMLLLYKSRLIQATPTFKKVIITSTIAVAIFYLAGIIGAFFGHPMTIFNGGTLGIGVSILICAIAAFNFIIDFNYVEQGAKNLLPRYFEWYFGFSILVTLIWLYLEVLRLLAQLNSRRN